MKIVCGIVIAECLCQSQIDGSDYWEDFAFDLSDLSSIKMRHGEINGEHTCSIYMKSMESFVIQCDGNTLLKEWKAFKKSKIAIEQ